MKYYYAYKHLHSTKKYGISGDFLVDRIKLHVPDWVTSILDWGAGQSNTVALLSKKLNIGDVYAYDPCVVGRDELPEKQYDWFVCTDVLEHVPEEELDMLFASLKRYSKEGIFVIALRLAGETLPNGENAHCTVKPEGWWEATLREHYGSLSKLPSLSEKGKVVAFYVREEGEKPSQAV